MVGDGDSTEDITLPLVFLFSREGALLTAALEEHHNVDVVLLPKERQLGQGGGKSKNEATFNKYNSTIFLVLPRALFSKIKLILNELKSI